jgi:hypothetical protein
MRSVKIVRIVMLVAAFTLPLNAQQPHRDKPVIGVASGVVLDSMLAAQRCSDVGASDALPLRFEIHPHLGSPSSQSPRRLRCSSSSTDATPHLRP